MKLFLQHPVQTSLSDFNVRVSTDHQTLEGVEKVLESANDLLLLRKYAEHVVVIFVLCLGVKNFVLLAPHVRFHIFS